MMIYDPAGRPVTQEDYTALRKRLAGLTDTFDAAIAALCPKAMAESWDNPYGEFPTKDNAIQFIRKICDEHGYMVDEWKEICIAEIEEQYKDKT